MRTKKGSVLAITVGFVLAFTLIGMQAIYLAGVNREITQKQASSAKAFWLAETGVAQTIWVLNRNNWTDWSGSGSTRNISVSMGTSGDYDVLVNGAGDDTAVITSTGYFPPVRRTIQVNVVRDALFNYALFGNNGVNIGNGNVYIDSYDSDIPGYTGSNGDVGSNDGDILLGNKPEIAGDVNTGPGDSIIAGHKATMGDTSSNNNIYLPPIVIPTSLVNMAEQTFDNQPIAAGVTAQNYKYSSVTLSGPLTITGTGTVNLYVTGSFNGGSNDIVIPSGVKLNIYIDGTFSYTNNAGVNVESAPGNFVIFSTYNSINNSDYGVDINNNNVFYGAIYAPNAAIKLSQNSMNSDLYGSVIGKYIDAPNNIEIHYDEALGRSGFPFPGGSFYSQHLWQELG